MESVLISLTFVKKKICWVLLGYLVNYKSFHSVEIESS